MNIWLVHWSTRRYDMRVMHVGPRADRRESPPSDTCKGSREGGEYRY